MMTKQDLDKKLMSIDVQEAMEEAYFLALYSDDPEDRAFVDFYWNTVPYINHSDPEERRLRWEEYRRDAIYAYESQQNRPKFPPLPEA